ncbi:MAG: DUF6850 family outer membrane beta-barrel protein [Fidelibacterota bacterium]
MMKKLSLLLLLFSLAIAQEHNLIREYTMTRLAGVDNPARITGTEYSDQQQYGVLTTYGTGDFRLPFQPEEHWYLDYFTAGNKRLFDRGVFSGYVAFHQHQLGNKKWVHNRNPYFGLPFLLADSSVGDMSLNGIHWQLGYSQEIIDDKLALGGRLFYNVDEEMKSVFPKPIIKHRDMMLTLGVSSQIVEQFSAGMTYSYFNFQEIMNTSKYSLDQDKTPLFFKIRGLDNPIIFRGETSEERQQDFIGHNLKIDSKITNWLVREMNLSAEYETGSVVVVDGGAYPVDQGTMDVNNLYFSGDMILPLYQENCLRVSAFGEKRLHNATHPDIDIEIFEYKKEQLAGQAELILPVGRRIVLMPGLFGVSAFTKRIDKFNGVLGYFPATQLGGSLGLRLSWAEKFISQWKLAYASTEVTDDKNFTERSDWYYNEITTIEQAWFRADHQSLRIDADLRYRTGMNSWVVLDLHYYQTTAVSGDFESTDRTFLSAAIKLELRK